MLLNSRFPRDQKKIVKKNKSTDSTEYTEETYVSTPTNALDLYIRKTHQSVTESLVITLNFSTKILKNPSPPQVLKSDLKMNYSYEDRELLSISTVVYLSIKWGPLNGVEIKPKLYQQVVTGYLNLSSKYTV